MQNKEQTIMKIKSQKRIEAASKKEKVLSRVKTLPDSVVMQIVQKNMKKYKTVLEQLKDM